MANNVDINIGRVHSVDVYSSLAILHGYLLLKMMTELRCHGLSGMCDEIHRVHPRSIHRGEDYEGDLVMQFNCADYPKSYMYITTKSCFALDRLSLVHRRANCLWTKQRFLLWSWFKEHEEEMIARYLSPRISVKCFSTALTVNNTCIVISLFARC